MKDRYPKPKGWVRAALAPLAPQLTNGGLLADKQWHAAVAAMNMQTHAERQVRMFKEDGTELAIEARVYVVDGYKNWPSVLAKALIAAPEQASGTRQDMSDLIQRELAQSEPFPPTRLSKALSEKAKKVVAVLLSDSGYTASKLTNGLSIRDAVRAGREAMPSAATTIETMFHVDGVTFGEKGKFYPYVSCSSYDDRPWYRLGISFAGVVLPLAPVLAMRGIGVSRFIEQDDGAVKRATGEQRQARVQLIGAGAVR
ncbi:hypothetical protein [Burkholderia stagnalis]|uniref:hypothetical protein n=1 Tax=Burkholderia stagnalis TaxID=1503054 RepID=UPI0012D99306|nr:hypothetical protein [Burkholderia stagnalis]